MQIHERQRNAEGGWADETLPGNGPRRGETHPFDGLLRRIHRFLNPPQPDPPREAPVPSTTNGRGGWS